MITFDLNCSNGHQFEGWFASSADFDAQKSSGLLACPACNDGIVQKALSVPNVPRKGNQRPALLPSVTPDAAETSVDAPATAVLPSAMAELVQKLARAQSEMLDKSQWVGGNFAEPRAPYIMAKNLIASSTAKPAVMRQRRWLKKALALCLCYFRSSHPLQKIDRPIARSYDCGRCTHSSAG